MDMPGQVDEPVPSEATVIENAVVGFDRQTRAFHQTVIGDLNESTSGPLPIV